MRKPWHRLERLYRESRQISTMFLGGGGFIFPRWIESLFPFNPIIHVAELDPAVKQAVEPLTDHRGSAEYKREMSAVMVARALTQAWDAAQRSARASR